MVIRTASHGMLSLREALRHPQMQLSEHAVHTIEDGRQEQLLPAPEAVAEQEGAHRAGQGAGQRRAHNQARLERRQLVPARPRQASARPTSAAGCVVQAGLSTGTPGGHIGTTARRSPTGQAAHVFLRSRMLPARRFVPVGTRAVTRCGWVHQSCAHQSVPDVAALLRDTSAPDVAPMS